MKKEVHENDKHPVSNLAALRERVIKDSANNQPKQHSEDGANIVLQRKRKLVQTDLQAVQEAYEALGGNEVDVDDKKKQPPIKHSQAIANVAKRLNKLSDKEKNSIKNPETDTEKQYELNNPAKDDAKDAIAIAMLADSTANKSNTKNTKKNEVATNKLIPSVPLIRTFRSDVENTIAKNRTSVVDMIASEQNRQGLHGEIVRKAPQKKVSAISFALIILSIAFIASAFTIGIFMYLKLNTKQPETGEISSLLPSNEAILYDISNQSKTDLLSGLVTTANNMNTELGFITEFKLVEHINTSEDTFTIEDVTPTRFIEKLETTAPKYLIRSFTNTMALGVHKLKNNEIFWVQKTNDHDMAYRGMYAWEDSISSDLTPLFWPYNLDDDTAPDTTATTSEKNTITPLKKQFKDVVIANIQMRILQNNDEDTYLLWAIPDDSTIIITTNKTTMRVLLEKVILQTH